MQVKRTENLLGRLRHSILSDDELARLLLSHFGSAASDHENRQVYYPASAPYALRLVYSSKGKLTAIYPEEGFNSELGDKLQKRIDEEIKGISEISRAVLFSRFRSVQGSWRYKDEFQILPVPPEAPRAHFEVGDHPFLLEFSYPKGPEWFQNAFRRSAVAKKLEMLLNALLVTPINSFNLKSAGPKGWSWVLLPREEKESGLRVAYCQHFYHYEGLDCVGAEFLPTNHVPTIKTRPVSEYYHGMGRLGTREEFELPVDLSASFDLFFAFPKDRQDRFLQACFWLGQVKDSSSVSQGFLAAIQAVEALIPSPGKCDSCPDCGKSLGPSRTDQFINLLEKLVPPTEEDKALRRTLYRVRSDLSHGFAPPFLADTDIGGSMNPKEWEEMDYAGRAMGTARAALHAWLHLPDVVSGK